MHGNLFGGFMMQYLDEAGASFAMRTCRSSKMVTKFIANVSFDRPVHVGDIVKIYGEVKSVGTTSITINLVAKRADTYTTSEETVCSTSMTFVRIAKNGKSREIDSSVRYHFEVLGKTKK
jgi:acyl-CoA thioesterase YciA